MKFSHGLTIDYSEMMDIVEALCTNDPLIQFSIFNTNDQLTSEDKWIVDIPDINSSEPVIKGETIFTINYWRISEEPVFSPLYDSPTWKDIINACNNLLQEGDHQGIYLEGLKVHKDTAVRVVEFVIGS